MQVLYDTDFLLSFLVSTEINNKKAISIYKKHNPHELFALNLVKFELATVLSRKFDHTFAKQIVLALSEVPFQWLSISEIEEEAIWREYFSYNKKNISFIDSANLVVARTMNMKIATFDSFYPNEIVLK
ncbi:MAG: PIN domain-containing protein [Candidatus Roizmanbacteria bacterium]